LRVWWVPLDSEALYHTTGGSQLFFSPDGDPVLGRILDARQLLNPYGTPSSSYPEIQEQRAAREANLAAAITAHLQAHQLSGLITTYDPPIRNPMSPFEWVASRLTFYGQPAEEMMAKAVATLLAS